MWNGLTLSYDNNSRTLTIPDSNSSINDPEAIVYVLNDRTVTKIVIENPLKIWVVLNGFLPNLGI